MRWIYLSPHLDDAVLSCGGLIWEQSRRGLPVEVWTVCAGDAPPGPLSALAQRCHSEWGTASAEETLALRRREDRAATHAVGAACRHFDLPDCIYRRTPEGGARYAELFVPLDPGEAGLIDRTADELAAALEPEDALVCPLSIGGHPDHVLTRGAAERLGRPLRYYADLPYLLAHPEALGPATAGMTLDCQPVSARGLEAWQAAIAAYASQIPVLFGDGQKMRAKIKDYWGEQHALPLWRG